MPVWRKFTELADRDGIVLIGAGGHALSCVDVIERESKFRILGLLGQEHEVGQTVGGYPVIGPDSKLAECLEMTRNFLVCVGHIKDSSTRQRLFDRVHHAGGQFPVIISPEAYVSPAATLGSGTIVHHKAIINTGCRVGVNGIINSGALVEHGASIGNHCHVSTGALVNGGVRIGDGTFIGSGAMVKQGVCIGSRAVIAMGAIVKEDVPDGGWVSSGRGRI